MRFTFNKGNILYNLVLLVSFYFLFTSFFRLFDISISSYFSQDDFFHLRQVMDKNISDIPGFFIGRLEGQTFYRPLSRETYNLIMYKVFNLNPLSFHLFNLFLILINAIFLIFITKKLANNLAAAYFSLFIYFVSSAHSIELYYLSSFQTLLSTSFVLLSVYFYVLYLDSRNINRYLVSLLMFSVALFSHESSLILPGFILILEILYGKKFSFKHLIYKVLPFFLLGTLFLISTTSITTLPAQKVYQPSFNFKSILNTFGWYIAWSLGFPEMLVDFVGSGLKLKTEFLIWYKDYARIIFPLIFFFCSIQILFILHLRKTLIKNKFLIFSILAFVISLLPFLFFPQHKFVYYLSLALIWFSIIFGVVLSVAWRYSRIHKMFVILVVMAFSIVASKTIEINSITHWAAKRAKSAEVLIKNFKKDYPLVSKGSIFYIVDDPDYPFIANEWGTSSRQAFYILSGSDALQLLYKDPTIKVYYQALGGLPKGIDRDKVITFTAKFPY